MSIPPDYSEEHVCLSSELRPVNLVHSTTHAAMVPSTLLPEGIDNRNMHAFPSIRQCESWPELSLAMLCYREQEGRAVAGNYRTRCRTLVQKVCT